MEEQETFARDRASEVHRYFPEWADRPSGPDVQHEAERNSYLAGGYADEFGYGTDPGRPPAILPLDGEPEDSSLWREQIGALHPGYPQCAKPLDRYGVEPRPRPPAARLSCLEPRAPAQRGFKIIQVGLRNVAPSHPTLRLAVISLVVERLIRRRHLKRML